MQDLFTPLTDSEFDMLDRFLLDRIDEDEIEGKNPEEIDEGVLGISELDGFFTAIVSSPVVIQPSQWLPSLWGEFEPAWENEKHFEQILGLLLRYMNNIAGFLVETTDAFEPIFMQREVKGETYDIVDEWCEGYLRGIQLAEEEWHVSSSEIAALLAPILAFTTATDWLGHETDAEEARALKSSISPNVRKIHAYWLQRRSDEPPTSPPHKRRTPRVGRNDPCPCGSGKKYKKCCLH